MNLPSINEHVPQATRAAHIYAIPDSIGRVEIDGRHYNLIRLVELTANEELIAINRSGGSPVKIAYELAKESFRAFGDGSTNDPHKIAWKELRSHDGTVDRAWELMPAKVRNMIVSAYNDIHVAAEAESKSFLSSKIVVQ